MNRKINSPEGSDMDSAKTLEDYVQANTPNHMVHITPGQVRALFVVANDAESPLSVQVQRIIAQCRVCSVALAESRPTYASVAPVIGARSATR
jgi:hypothetical protein